MIRKIENSLHDAAVPPGSDDVRICSGPQDQAERTDKNRLPRSRLTRNDIEAAVEFNLDFLDQSVMDDAKAAEHGYLSRGILLATFQSSLRRRSS